jgi:hypothetical protein
MSRTPNIYEVVKAGLDSALTELHTAMPGIVRKYDAATQLADVQPSIQRRFRKPDGTEGTRDFPVIVNVPVAFPRAGGFFLSFPVAVGDFVLLVFSERSIDQWLEKGGIQDPIVTTLHDLSDAIAIPGVYPKGGKLASAHAQHMVLGPDSASAPRAYFKTNEIALGGESPSEFVALATLVKTELDKIHTWALVHMHPTAAPGVPSPPTPTVPALAAAASPVAATKVKAL